MCLLKCWVRWSDAVTPAHTIDCELVGKVTLKMFTRTHMIQTLECTGVTASLQRTQFQQTHSSYLPLSSQLFLYFSFFSLFSFFPFSFSSAAKPSPGFCKRATACALASRGSIVVTAAWGGPSLHFSIFYSTLFPLVFPCVVCK